VEGEPSGSGAPQRDITRPFGITEGTGDKVKGGRKIRHSDSRDRTLNPETRGLIMRTCPESINGTEEILQRFDVRKERSMQLNAFPVAGTLLIRSYGDTSQKGTLGLSHHHIHHISEVI
jgi:hypothetical protein